MHTVLIGSAGTSTAFGTCVALRRTWSQSVRLVLMDINPQHLVTATLLGDVFIQCPLAKSADFEAFVLSVFREYRIDTWLPLLPEEILLACKLQRDPKFDSNCKVLLPRGDAAVICSDKWLLAQALQKNNIPTPKTTLASGCIGEQVIFIKPRVATGARGARSLPREQLLALDLDDPNEWIVQEKCDGPEITIDAFFDSDAGELISVARERVEVKLGVSTKVRIFFAPELQEMAEHLACALQLEGSFCFQVMRGRNRWLITDVNPRPGGATAMSVAVGQDFFSASFAYHWGEDWRRFFTKMAGEHFVTRQYAEFLMT